jgi:hypothetical protein
MTHVLNQRVVEIKNKYKLGYGNDTMLEALKYARERIRGTAFVREKGRGMITDSNNVLTLCNHVMDSDFDGVISKEDIVVKQYLRQSPYTVVDLTSNISSVIFDHPSGFTYIIMDNKYPSQGYELEISYSRGVVNPSQAEATIKYLEELYVIQHLFKILPVYKLQRGLTTLNINGVDITFDKNSIDDFLKQLSNWISNEIMKVKPFSVCDVQGFGNTTPLMKSILINKGY